jgi:hypothetical protein
MECPVCNNTIYSLFDKKYTQIYNHCWSCDLKMWRKDELTLDEFEKRESRTLKEMEGK